MRAFFTNFSPVFPPEKARRIEMSNLVADADQLAFKNLMEESNANMAAAKKSGDAIQGDDLASTPTLNLLESLLSDEDLFTEMLQFASDNPGRITNQYPRGYTFAMKRLIALEHQMMVEGLFNKVSPPHHAHTSCQF
jgi:hypothetical protein